MKTLGNMQKYPKIETVIHSTSDFANLCSNIQVWPVITSLRDLEHEIAELEGKQDHYRTVSQQALTMRDFPFADHARQLSVQFGFKMDELAAVMETLVADGAKPQDQYLMLVLTTKLGHEPIRTSITRLEECYTMTDLLTRLRK